MKSVRRIAIALVVALGLLVPVQAAPASAATRCAGGSQASSASSVVRSQWSSGLGYYVKLIYSSYNRCVYAWVSKETTSMPVGSKVWLDISTNGGRTWEGRIDQRTASSSGYPALSTLWWYDGARVARACSQRYSGPITCTTWF